MIDLHEGVLELFVEAQRRHVPAVPYDVLGLPQAGTRTRPVPRGRPHVKRCTSCGRRGHDANRCIETQDWNA